MQDIIKQRRERLIWAIVAIIFIFALLNGMGIIQTGHFEREPTPTPIGIGRLSDIGLTWIFPALG
jgi:hypothetical protein